MASLKQIEANRANAQKSTGPTSVAGKEKVTLNILGHSHLSRAVVLETESNDRFEDLLSRYLLEYEPQGPTQFSLVHIMAVAKWRMQRLWNMESAGMDYELKRQANPSAEPDFATMNAPTRAHFAFRALDGGSGRTLQSMGRDESRFERYFSRALGHLLRLRREKEKNENRKDEPIFKPQENN